MSELAIVIPAFKEFFFREALQSWANQTCKSFTIYIGDDCSPYDLLKIVNEFDKKLTIHYTRFPENIGARNLVNHWKRCVSLTKEEKWLWLFSDDDIVDPNCVENFFKLIAVTVSDVFRFNTIIINKNGEIKEIMPEGPFTESSEEMAYNLLLGYRGNSMPDHIFSREIYNKHNGFVFTEYAQGADWASSILFSSESGIKIIPNAYVYWRYSGLNISSLAALHKHSMVNGHIQFTNWTLNHFRFLKNCSSSITYGMMKSALSHNLKTVLKEHFRGYPSKDLIKLFNLFHKNLGLSFYTTIAYLIEIQEHKYPVILNLKHKFYWIKNKFRKRDVSLAKALINKWF